MLHMRFLVVLGCSLALISSSVQAQTFFVDDFNDMNIQDNQPVSWRPGLLPGLVSATTGDLVVHAVDGGPITHVVDNNQYGDVRIKTQFRVDGDFGATGVSTGILARTISVSAGYLAGMNGLGTIFILVPDSELRVLGFHETGLDPKQTDIEMEFGLAGNQLDLRAWAAGGPRPAVAPILVTNEEFQKGFIGVIHGPRGTSTATFRSYSAQPIPEPSGWLLILLGVLSLVGSGRRASHGIYA